MAQLKGNKSRILNLQNQINIAFKSTPGAITELIDRKTDDYSWSYK